MESFGIDLKAIEQSAQQFMISIIVLITIIFIIAICILWLIIKSAVRAGVEEAIEKKVVDVRLIEIKGGLMTGQNKYTTQQPYYYTEQQYNEEYSGEPYNEEQF